jgi:hypothetical protein
MSTLSHVLDHEQITGIAARKAFPVSLDPREGVHPYHALDSSSPHFCDGAVETSYDNEIETSKKILEQRRNFELNDRWPGPCLAAMVGP